MHKFLTAIILINFLSACTYLPNMPDFSESLSNISETLAPKIYSKEIKQGSVIRSDKFNLLKVGMTKNEIRKLIGSPSVLDQFHRNQWEYIYYSVGKEKEITSMRITLFFNDNSLIRIEEIDSENLKKIESDNFHRNPSAKSLKEVENTKNRWYQFWR